MRAVIWRIREDGREVMIPVEGEPEMRRSGMWDVEGFHCETELSAQEREQAEQALIDAANDIDCPDTVRADKLNDEQKDIQS